MGRRQGRGTQARFQVKSSSSSQVVILNNEDLLTLILLRVPWKTLMSSKCVSRQWLSLITAPHFTRLRSLNPLRTSGLFFDRPNCIGEKNKVYFVHLDHSNIHSPFRTLTFADDPYPEFISILQSCKGLFLCHTSPDALIGPYKRNHYVYNPSTNQLDTLPKHPCHDGYGLPCINLTFDPSKSLQYRVIAFLARPRSNVGDFYIYSSETGTWRDSIRSYFASLDVCFRDGVYWNGCLHWLSRYSYDQPVSDCLYFNVDKERLETFPTPPIGKWSSEHSYFGESEDHLHYIEVDPYATSFNVYEMKSDYSGWFVKYQIDLVPISKVFPMMKKASFCIGDRYNAAVASLIRREKFKEDSFLVLELPGKMIRYNLVDRSFRVIWDFAIDLMIVHDSLRHWSCGNFKGWPYIE